MYSKPNKTMKIHQYPDNRWRDSWFSIGFLPSLNLVPFQEENLHQSETIWHGSTEYRLEIRFFFVWFVRGIYFYNFRRTITTISIPMPINYPIQFFYPLLCWKRYLKASFLDMPNIKHKINIVSHSIESEKLFEMIWIYFMFIQGMSV